MKNTKASKRQKGNGVLADVGSSAYAIVKCISCSIKKKVGLKQERDYTPMCDKCFMPMIVEKVVGRT